MKNNTFLIEKSKASLKEALDNEEQVSLAGLLNKKAESSLKALLNEKEAAQYLDLAEGTLPVWRSTGRYQIPFIKIGANVRYRKSDLDAWLESRTQKTTA